MTKKRKIVIASAALAGVLVLFLGYWFWFRPFQEKKSVKITEKIHLLKETIVPLRFKIVSYDGNVTRLAVKLFDLDNKITGRFESNISNGSDIGFAFSDIEIEKKHIIFPVEMRFTDSTGNLKTVDLKEHYFTKEGYPGTYNSELIDSVLKTEIGKLSALYLVNDMQKIEKRYHSVFTTIKQTLKQPSERTPYEMVIKSNGEIFFKKMNYAK